MTREQRWLCKDCGTYWDESDVALREEVDEIYYICPECEFDLVEDRSLSKREIDEIRADFIRDEMLDDRATGDL